MSIRKSNLSKEEIIKQFDLPERKSKIATLLKQDEQAYCICRSSDASRFMIGCDACEEWYHGDCINITEKEAKYIKQFFCVRCKEEDPTLMTRYKVQKTEAEKLEYKKKKEKDKIEKKEKKWTSKRCGDCINCQRKHDCGKCNGCTNIYKQKCIFRICTNRNKAIENRDSRYKKQRVKIKQKEFLSKCKRGRKRKDSGSSNEITVVDAPKQCYGPMCTKPSRPQSKYCSDTCGLKLATNRIYQVLPQRIQEWSLSCCVAEENNKKALEAVRKQQLEVRRILHELDKRHLELDAVIARGKQCKVEEFEDKMEDEESEVETSMYCITCGHEIHSRTAIKHMDKCFNKYESQASFGSIYKTRIQGNNMFCDFYNATNKTYCKRLKVLCPEHSKEPKAAPTEVCGCPLVTNVFDLTGEYCQASKRNCVKHYAWEKLRRAEIDMERVRQWLKIDELVEKERQLRYELATRAGVLALMLHSTYNHDLMEQLAAAQQQKKLSKSRIGFIIMDTPTTPTFAFRRSTRTALTEIPARHGISTADNPRHFALTNLVTRPSNLNRSPNSAPSPEELVIQQRGRRRIPVTWSPDIDAKKREGPLAKEKTPIKMQGKESPAKSSTLVLRSSPRKRLIMNDSKESGFGSPEKFIRKGSPNKKLRSEKQFLHSLFPSNLNSSCGGSLSPGQSSPLQSALKGLSQEQLIRVFENVLVKHPHLESEIMEILPAPDIKPLEDKLMYLKKNIFKSLPNSRLTSKTDSPAYSRAATHVIAFKKCVVEQGKTLLDSQHWNSVLEYVLIAWGYVKATPLWDNPPHNASRKQCFKSLAAMAISALKKGSWTEKEIEEIYIRFKLCDEESEDIQTCLKQINLMRKV